MRKAPLFSLLLALSGLAVAPALAARLVSQSVKGAKRECVYEARPGARPRTGDLQPAVRVGIGEPCPYFYPRPNTYEERIPRLATLVDRARANGQTLCVYAYNGRRYTRAIEASRICPLTPIF
ncbi:MAG TPA: hypothetical protein VLK25_14505 [Allosphingosinicella sp.]|nr:hypothetical protein [Allosphingosinicella sp.]